MQVQVSPETQSKLDRLALDTGRSSGELLADAVDGLFDEFRSTSRTLDSRYDELESGRVKPIAGEDAYRRLKARTEEERARWRT